jgi:hypothetical protein
MYTDFRHLNTGTLTVAHVYCVALFLTVYKFITEVYYIRRETNSRTLNGEMWLYELMCKFICFIRRAREKSLTT